MKAKLVQIVNLFICLGCLKAQSIAGEMHRESVSSRESFRETNSGETKGSNSKEHFSDKSLCKPVNGVAKLEKQIDKDLGWPASKLEKQSSTKAQEALCAIFYGENKEPNEKSKVNGGRFNQIELPSHAQNKPARFNVAENKGTTTLDYYELPPPPPKNVIDNAKEPKDEPPPPVKRWWKQSK